MLDEIAREPIEQLRIRRPLTHSAEVRGRADKADAKMVEPDAVHQHSWDKRICATGEPSRVGKSTAAGSKVWILRRQRKWLARGREYRKSTRQDWLFRLFRVATMEKIGHWHLVRGLG